MEAPPMNTVPELLLREVRVVDLTLGTIYKALLDTKGNLTRAALSLECSRTALKKRIESIPAFVQLISEFRDGYIDRAEENIFNDVEKGDQSASRFVLSTVGKDRGWSQGIAGTGKGGEIEVTIRTFAEPTGANDDAGKV